MKDINTLREIKIRQKVIDYRLKNNKEPDTDFWIDKLLSQEKQLKEEWIKIIKEKDTLGFEAVGAFKASLLSDLLEQLK